MESKDVSRRVCNEIDEDAEYVNAECVLISTGRAALTIRHVK